MLKALLPSLLAILASTQLLVTPPAAAQTTLSPASREKHQNQISRNAPLVFVGRPYIGRLQEDSVGRLYEATVIQVVEVLRGQEYLRPGTLQLIDSLPDRPYPRTTDGPQQTLTQRRQLRMYSPGTYGIYFCALPVAGESIGPQDPATTPLLQLHGYGRNRRQAKVIVPGDGKQSIKGLYKQWTDQAHLTSYLATVPKLRALPQALTLQNYPQLTYTEALASPSAQQVQEVALLDRKARKEAKNVKSAPKPGE